MSFYACDPDKVYLLIIDGYLDYNANIDRTLDYSTGLVFSVNSSIKK